MADNKSMKKLIAKNLGTLLLIPVLAVLAVSSLLKLGLEMACFVVRHACCK